jgi:protein-S-isoprenylcysteine O-methyltransferase Ste14
MTARRLLVPGLFLLVAVLTGASALRATAHALAHPGGRAALVALYYALRTGIALAFSIFTLGRAKPARNARSIVAFAACAIAMAGAVAFRPPEAGTSSGLVLAGDLVAVVSCIWLLYAVANLGRCFGVLPEARGLVTDGPYRFVRHPVYLGETGACIGLVLAAPVFVNCVGLMALIGAQLVRMRLEERALTEAYPRYAAYAAVTPALVPGLSRSRGSTGLATSAESPSGALAG